MAVVDRWKTKDMQWNIKDVRGTENPDKTRLNDTVGGVRAQHQIYSCVCGRDGRGQADVEITQAGCTTVGLGKATGFEGSPVPTLRLCTALGLHGAVGRVR